MDRGTWWAEVHRAAQSDMTDRLSTAQHSIPNENMRDSLFHV